MTTLCSNNSRYRPQLFVWIIITLCISSCGSYKNDKKFKGYSKNYILVRSAETGEFVKDATITCQNSTNATINGKVIGKTDEHGLVISKGKKENKKIFGEGSKILVTKDGFKDQSFPAERYLKFYDLYVKTGESGKKNTSDFKVADMHYHVSMKPHNTYGHLLYGKNYQSGLPSNVAWMKLHKGLRVMHEGKWKKAKLKCGWPGKKKKIERREILLEGKMLKAKPGNNSFKHFTQATHPHLFDGHVKLAFNAISPFEHNLSRGNGKKFVNSYLKSGAKMNWLKYLGDKDPNKRLSHWNNFQLEYQLICNQFNGSSFAQKDWGFYEHPIDLADSSHMPLVVNVVEGAHILQDKYFPHLIDYDIDDRSFPETEVLAKKLIDASCSNTTSIEKKLQEYSDLGDTKRDPNSESTREFREKLDSRRLSKQKEIDQLINEELTTELTEHIDSLKDFTNIKMVTIAHLSFNGMMGHAPALDDGRFPGKQVAARVYSMRVSDDFTYQDQWKSVFYTIPGPNNFGKKVMKNLLNTENGKRQIAIDLKHCDYVTRKYFYDSLMTSHPPIFSHGAAAGYSSDYYSPFNDEYSILKSDFTQWFYPFAINLLDDEIAIYAEKDGIIGITLEQRVLGGYINKKYVYPYHLSNHGRLASTDRLLFNRKKIRSKKTNRREYLKRYICHIIHPEDRLLSDSKVQHRIDSIINYTQEEMRLSEIDSKSIQEKRIRKVIADDYVSLEPFMRNLIHIIDQTKQKREDAWEHVCLGSDLDGLVDPIDICPTATQYPRLYRRLNQFIPIFLEMKYRNERELRTKHDTFDAYYRSYFDWETDDNPEFTLENALDMLFYESLRSFTYKNL